MGASIGGSSVAHRSAAGCVVSRPCRPQHKTSKQLAEFVHHQQSVEAVGFAAQHRSVTAVFTVTLLPALRCCPWLCQHVDAAAFGLDSTVTLPPFACVATCLSLAETPSLRSLSHRLLAAQPGGIGRDGRRPRATCHRHPCPHSCASAAKDAATAVCLGDTAFVLWSHCPIAVLPLPV